MTIEIKISDMTAADTLLGDELIAGVQSGENVKITPEQIKTFCTEGLPFFLVVACSDETTALTTGTAKITFRLPTAITLTEVRASLNVAQTSGSIFTVDINNNGSSILSTKITVDNGEKSSVTATIQPVISTSELDSDSECTVDIDQIGDGTAEGLKITLIGVYAS